MASESSFTAQKSIHELVGEKKDGDNTNEEEKHEPEDVSDGGEIKKEEEIEQVGEIKNYLQEFPASSSSQPANETNEEKSNDAVELFTSTEPVNTEFKRDPNDAEFAETFVSESKTEEGPLISTFEAETLETANSEDTKDEVQELVHGKVPTIVPDTLEGEEGNGASNLDRINVLAEDREAEASSSDGQKPEGASETIDDVELIESSSAKNPSDVSEAPEKIDLDSITPVHDTDVGLHYPEGKKQEEDDVDSITLNDTEVPVKDSDVVFDSPEGQNQAEGAGNEEPIKSIGSENLNEEVLESVPDKVSINVSEAPEKSDVASTILTAIEVPVNDLEVQSGYPEEQEQADDAEIKEHDTLEGSGISNKEVEELVPPKEFINASESENSGADSSTLTTIEIPVKDLEVESGYPEEQKHAEDGGIKERFESDGSGNSTEHVQELTPHKVNASEAPETSDVDSSTLNTIEVPVKELEVESGYPREEKHGEGAGFEEDIELIASEKSNDEVQELVSSKVSSDSTEAPEKSDGSSSLANVEIPVKDLEVESGHLEEQKSEGSAQIKVNFELVKPEDSKDDQEFLPAEISNGTLAAIEKKDVDSSAPSSIEATVKDLEVESGSPQEQQLEAIVETKEPSLNTGIDGGDEVSVSSSYEEKSSGVEVHEKTDGGIKDEAIQTNTDLPEYLKTSSEVNQARPDEVTVSQEGPVEKDTIVEGGLETSTVLDGVPPVAKSSSVDEKNSDLGDSGIETKVPEVLLEGNILEEGNPFDKEKDVNVDVIDRGLVETSIDPIVAKDSNEQLQVPESVEEPLKVISKELNFSSESSEASPEEKREILKDECSTLAFESSSPELQKPEESAETKEPNSTATTIYDSSEIVGSSHHEEKPSGVAELVENKDEGTKREMIQTTDELPSDLEAISEANKTQSHEEEVSQESAVVHDRITEGGLETSTVLDVALPVVKASSEDEKVSDIGVVQLKNNGIDTVPKVSEVSLTGDIPEEGNLVDKEKDVYAESVENGLAQTSMDPVVATGSSEPIQAPENVERSLKVTSTEPIVSPIPDDVPLAEETVSAGDEKSQSLKGEASSLDETPQDNTISDLSPEQFIDEKKHESSKSGTNASASSPEEVKGIIASETYDEKEDETSKDLSLTEKTVNVAEKEEGKVEESIEDVTDKPEDDEGFGIEKKEVERAKGEGPIISSDIGDAKSIKETTKRESNIFTKVKRSIIKAKKAILRKSPGPKTVQSEAKDEKV